MSKGWALYSSYPTYVFGFHGCNESVGESILGGKVDHLKPSKNDYDWLGHGIYFWEANPARAFEFAGERASGKPVSKGDIDKPFVIGAIIDLGRCLNLLDSGALRELKDAYALFKASHEALSHDALPSNGQNKLRRTLDCAVIQTLHAAREGLKATSYQTVRGVFPEGEEVYPNAGFKDKDHIQICVRDTSCIKGYFRPIQG